MPKPTETALPGILLVLSLLLALSGCRAALSAPQSAEAERIAGSIYQLRQGRFVPLSGFGDIRPTPPTPWTVQARVSDMALLSGRVYLAVNGFGIARLDSVESAEPGFRYFYDSRIFAYRTFTTLIVPQESGDASLLCHVYFNRLLNVVAQSELKLQGISLLRFSAASGTYEVLTPPYQQAHPQWEAVGFVAVTPRQFFLEWKYSDRNRTLFSHTLYDIGETREQRVEALSYRNSYDFQEIEDSETLGLLLAEVRKVLDSAAASTAYQMLIRTEDRSLPTRYEYHPDDFASAEEIRLYSLSGVQRNQDLYLLLPDGMLLQGTSGSRRVRRMHLPVLPEGHVYGQLLLHEDSLLASWEQSAFTDVGAAGFFLAAAALKP